MSSDFKYVLSGGITNRFNCTCPLRVWDVASREKIYDLWNAYGSFVHVAITPDSKTAIACSAGFMSNTDTTIYMWDIASGREIASLSGHRQPVEGMRLAGTSAITYAVGDNRILFWDLASAREISKPAVPPRSRVSATPKSMLGGLGAHLAQISSVSIEKSQQFVLSGDKSGVIKYWDAGKPEAISERLHHNAPVVAVAAATTDRCFVSYSRDGIIKRWGITPELATYENIDYPYGICSEPASLVTMTVLTGQHSLVLCKGGQIWSIDWAKEPSKKEVFRLRNDVEVGRFVGSSPHLVVGRVDGLLEVIKLPEISGRQYRKSGRSLVSVAASDDLSRIAYLSRDGVLSRLQRVNGATHTSLDLESEDPIAVYFCGRDAVVLGASGWGIVDDEKGVYVPVYAGNKARFVDAAIDGAAHRLCCVDDGGVLQVWDLASGTKLAQFYAEAPLTCCCSISNDLFVAGSQNGAVHVLALESGKR